MRRKEWETIGENEKGRKAGGKGKKLDEKRIKKRRSGKWGKKMGTKKKER